jgi:RimJ/RimL family protein N-acetyltransferase
LENASMLDGDTLYTERLVLRPLTRADGPAIAAEINCYDISKNLSRVPFPYSLADAEAFLSWAEGLDHRSAFRHIALKQEPALLIGLISYDWVEESQQAELGYWLVQKHWGKGLMSEAARAMVAHAFSSGGIEQLGSCYFDENPASGRVLAHAGFAATGACAQFSRARNTEVPVTMMALSRVAWETQRTAPCDDGPLLR